LPAAQRQPSLEGPSIFDPSRVALSAPRRSFSGTIGLRSGCEIPPESTHQWHDDEEEVA